ncbi:double-strand break repair helicase AddA [Novosphingobium sp. PC22D]|uniref:double-strand break repair helicase AddA n=1 Tax=Novosphingobium sp. PC22D TaxID=1962403 RepID=UPI000BF114C1|nr:double-strand break repair helicase AddA [Novosphingobium sp. PC22D]PEQ11430.1 double-strand break repair helicase AddA [Novosphingobium sp. PC22D]
MSGPARIFPLHGNQMEAVRPDDTVWLTASAGTGKTQVLSSRVLRLLLQPDVEPSQILCLTFTKAGAAEMASRINTTLAEWVRLSDIDLFGRLEAIGAPAGEAEKARARTLFAKVLDCPGGGLRIDTIHAFSQWLLAAFPLEAQLLPGARPMEDRERAMLARRVLADLLVAAEGDPLGDPQLLDAVADLSLRMGPDAVEAYLLRCASAREAWFGPGSWQANDMRGHVLRLLGLPGEADADWLAAQCADAAFDVASLRRCMETAHGWGTKTGLAAVDAISGWLLEPPARRAESIGELSNALLTRDGTIRSLANLSKVDPEYPAYCGRVTACIARVVENANLLALADRLVPALRLGRAFAIAWDEAKAREGLIDFDDQIRRAAELLSRSDLSEWICYKLDRRFDHILVDEAQDTNAAQWDIIDALTGEFFAGRGQHDDKMRTLFVVGDTKQAIFRFQGTSPENFRRARERFRKQMEGAARNAAMLRGNEPARELRDLGLERNFRTAQDVLDFVDKAIATIGHERFGLDRPADPHRGEDRPGYVALWQPVDAVEEGEGAEGDDEQEWLSRPDRTLADRIARQVREWLEPAGPGFRLHKTGKRAEAGDIMVLVRKRRDLAGLVVAQLHAAGVPVAGVDRLRLGAPLAVKDLIAALRFAAQPLDSLNLANLLVSPLVGWSQVQLLEHGYREKHVPLWDHLRAATDPEVRAVLAQLGALLALADFEPPQALLQWLLVGPWQARRRLVARLGGEVNDPIDELVNAAHAYAVTGTPSLAGFLAWFEAGDGELKREQSGSGGQVRVMTVHGSKGLQAPIVILADAAGNPDANRVGGIDLDDPADPARRVPLPSVRKAEQAGRIREEAERVALEEQQEHWRLLYVAMTRAEEALFVGGALGPRDKGEPAPNSWYAQLLTIFAQGAELADPIWGWRHDWGRPPEPAAAPAAPELALRAPLPAWVERTPPVEARPPRPLAPSALGDDVAPDPPLPPGPATAMAMRRGTLLHKLIERLPDAPAGERRARCEAWLARNAAEFSDEERAVMAGDAVAVVGHPDWADLFGPGSLAEVPFSAVVGGQVVAGSVDRLLVTPDRVRLVDFKTTRRPPERIEDIPKPILRQMAAYVAALEAVFPGRAVSAAVLFTAVPRLLPLPAALIDPLKADLQATQ